WLTKIFSPVNGNQNTTKFFCHHSTGCKSSSRIVKSVDNGVPGDEDRGCVDALLQQIVTCTFGRTKMPASNPSRYNPVELLRQWSLEIASREPRFDVSETHTPVKGNNCRNHCRRSVSLSQHYVGLV